MSEGPEGKLTRKPLRRYLAILFIVFIAGFLVWILPYQEIVGQISNGSWRNWSFIHYQLLIACPLGVIVCGYVAVIHAFYQDVVFENGVVYRQGIGGRMKIAQFGDKVAVRYSKKGVAIFKNRRRSHFFAATHYQIPDSFRTGLESEKDRES